MKSPAVQQRQRSGKGKWSIRVGRLVFANAFGILMTALVFGILPGLQIVTSGGGKKQLVRSVTTLNEAPPESTEQEPEPPPPPPPDEPPPQMDQPQVSLADISGALNPSGTGAAVLTSVVTDAISNQAMAGFSLGGDEVKPRPVSTVQPRVPTNLRKQGLRGTVTVQFTVDAQGRVLDPAVLSTPNPALNEPTIEAIKKWRFEPGTRGGKRVPFKVKQPFNYG